jgi:hypothetical protein
MTSNPNLQAGALFLDGYGIYPLPHWSGAHNHLVGLSLPRVSKGSGRQVAYLVTGCPGGVHY